MNTTRARLPEWMSRWVQRPSSAPPSSVMHSRVEVCPPELWPSSLSWRGRFKRLLASSRWMPEQARPVNRLGLVKDEFLQHLADLDSTSAQALAERIARARSLRELWHLRSTMYNVVACGATQAEAERRMALMNRHFPMRAPRSGLAPLDETT